MDMCRVRHAARQGCQRSKEHTWTPTFAKLSIDDFEKVKIAAIHPDFW
jgi:hypothetical protein